MLFFSIPCQSQSAMKDYRAMKTYYKSGDYVNATLKAIDYLMIKQKNKKAQEVLSVSFNMAAEDLKTEISDLKEKSKEFSGDETVSIRKKILKKYQILKELSRKGKQISRIVQKPKYPFKFDNIDVTAELADADRLLNKSINSAAQMHYYKGVKYMKEISRKKQKLAAKEFKRAQVFVSKFRDSQTLYNEARKNATTRVAILPFENISGEGRFGSAGEMISDKLRSAILNSAAANEFIEIYTRDQLNIIMQEHDLNMNNGIMNIASIAKFGKALGIHLIITGKVMQLSAENKQTIKDGARPMTKEVVTGKETYYNDKGKKRTRNIYGNVTAYVYYHHKSSVANINGSYEVTDIETARTLASSQFKEQYVWDNNWATYDGDGRAAKTPSHFNPNELPYPGRTELANKVIDRLGDKIARKVISYIK